MNAQNSARLNTFRGRKENVLGNQAGQVPPAWKASNGLDKGKHVGSGSKILLSQLPLDVMDAEVEVPLHPYSV
jgi:THO complex subunit 4